MRSGGNLYLYNDLTADGQGEENKRLLMFNALTVDRHRALLSKLEALLVTYPEVLEGKAVQTYEQRQSYLAAHRNGTAGYMEAILADGRFQEIGSLVQAGSKAGITMSINTRPAIAVGHVSAPYNFGPAALRAVALLTGSASLERPLRPAYTGLSPHLRLYLRNLEAELATHGDCWRNLPALAQRVTTAAERARVEGLEGEERGAPVVVVGYDSEERVGVTCAYTGAHVTFVTGERAERAEGKSRNVYIHVNGQVWGFGRTWEEAVRDALTEQSKVEAARAELEEA